MALLHSRHDAWGRADARALATVVAICANVVLTGCARPVGVAASTLPTPAHVVVVVEETFSSPMTRSSATVPPRTSTGWPTTAR
jgi:hypothetical protein